MNNYRLIDYVCNKVQLNFADMEKDIVYSLKIKRWSYMVDKSVDEESVDVSTENSKVVDFGDDSYNSLNQSERIEWLSQKIFNKPSKDIKYVLVTGYIHLQLLEEELARTGLYQWVNVFKGDVKYPRDILDYNKFDIVQINMSTQDIHLVNDIRESLLKDNKNTKIVLNNDYTTEMWDKSFESPNTIGREIRNADMIFGTEYYQTTAISEISGRRCYIIPHPADIGRLKNLPKIPKKNIISTIWRRYDKHAYIPSLSVRDHGLTTQLIGVDKNLDPKIWLTTTLYDYVYAGTNFFDFTNQLRESYIVYDPFTYHSYNRSVVDCAAMGVAVVGSNRTQSVNVCYPYTKVDPYDVTGARRLIDKLINDKEFYDKVVSYALERSEVYNHANSKEKYLTALYQSLLLDDKNEQKNKAKKETNELGSGDDVLRIISLEKNRDGKKKN